MSRPTLSKKLLGLAEWLDGIKMDHNAKMVRSAARIVARDESKRRAKRKRSRRP